jgi:hypothetical protein
MCLNLHLQSVKNKGEQRTSFYNKIQKNYINWKPNLYNSSKQFYKKKKKKKNYSLRAKLQPLHYNLLGYIWWSRKPWKCRGAATTAMPILGFSLANRANPSYWATPQSLGSNHCRHVVAMFDGAIQ